MQLTIKSCKWGLHKQSSGKDERKVTSIEFSEIDGGVFYTATEATPKQIAQRYLDIYGDHVPIVTNARFENGGVFYECKTYFEGNTYYANKYGHIPEAE